MKTNMLTIAALLLTVAAVTSMISATPMAVYAGGDHDGRDRDGKDSSETNTEQKLRQNNIGDSDSTNFNCGQNLISSPNVDQICEALDEEGTDGGDGGDPTVECETCIAAFVDAVGTTNPLITAALDLLSCGGFDADDVDALILALNAVPLIDATAVVDLEACLDAVLAAV